MKLLRLHLQGFKSFRDKTTIHFDDGITGIVGPNGCGKSNIVDALFWVMGEQSAKHLRGKSMQDLIFSGSDKYSPASFAEVTLVLGNDNGKHIHIGNQVVKPNEIQLTRKLYRNNETEYRINNTPARLKDIQEVFMDTGAGAKSYSIIAQGEINRLVQAKPVERRTMIEEVAGITKFKKRKQESLRKIEQTQSNLNRLNDLQSEIYKNLKSLERQAEQAERAKTLKEKVKKYELLVESHKEFNFLKDFSDAYDIIAKGQTALSEFIIKKDSLEVTLQEERNLRTELTEKVDEAQLLFNKVSRDLAAKEERLSYLKKNRVEKEENLKSRINEISSLKEEIYIAQNKSSELASQKEELENENQEDINFKELELEVNGLKEKLIELENNHKAKKDQLSALKESLVKKEQEYFKITSKIEEYAKNLEDISQEIEILEGQSSQFSGELSRQKDAQKLAEETFINHKEQFEQAQKLLSELNQQERELEASFRNLSREVMALESKKQSLIEINKTLEGAKDGAIKFLNEVGEENNDFLGKIIESDEKYAKALEALFGHHFNSLISKDGYSSLKNWLESSSSEQSLELIDINNNEKISEEAIERLRIKGCEGLIPVNSLIQLKDKQYQNILNLVEGNFIVENLTIALALSIPHDVRFNGLVSSDGKVVVKKLANGHQVLVRKESDLAQGVVQRNNEIKRLEGEYVLKSEELKNLEVRLDETIKAANEAKTSYESSRELLNKSQSEHITKKTALESKEEGFKTAYGRLEILRNRQNEISRSRLEILEKDDSYSREIKSITLDIANFEKELIGLDIEYKDLKSEYEQKRESYVALEVNARTFASRLQSIENQIENMNYQIQKYEERLASNSELVTNLENEIEEVKSLVSELEVDNNQLITTLKEKESNLSSVKEELTKLVNGMQGRESEVKDLSSQINKLEKQLVESEVKMAQIVVEEEMTVKNIFENHQIDLREVIANELQLTEEVLAKLNNIDSIFTMESENGPMKIEKQYYHFERRYGQALRECKDKHRQYKSELNRLGEINWQAIEDYNHQKLRYDFLKVQEVELKKSLSDLETAISHIDEKSKVRFKEAFTDVNDKFQKVFPIIFGGGSANLEITSNLDDPECGIDIIAQPPGKKMQNINLMSGGEKAMTAVSLIFSIFLVKPSPFCLLDEVDAPLDDANVGRFNELLREMSVESQFILITHNKKTMELNDTLYGVTMQEPGISKAVSVQLQ